MFRCDRRKDNTPSSTGPCDGQSNRAPGRTPPRRDRSTGALTSAQAGGQSTDFVYDADGNRLIRRTPDGHRTLYITGSEITADNAGTVTATRYYATGDTTVAARRTGGANGTLSWLIGDAQGTQHLAVNTATNTVDRQDYTPSAPSRALLAASALPPTGASSTRPRTTPPASPPSAPATTTPPSPASSPPAPSSTNAPPTTSKRRPGGSPPGPIRGHTRGHIRAGHPGTVQVRAVSDYPLSVHI